MKSFYLSVCNVNKLLRYLFNLWTHCCYVSADNDHPKRTDIEVHPARIVNRTK